MGGDLFATLSSSSGLDIHVYLFSFFFLKAVNNNNHIVNNNNDVNNGNEVN